MPLYWPVKPITNPFGPQALTRMAPHVPFRRHGNRARHCDRIRHGNRAYHASYMRQGSHVPLSGRMPLSGRTHHGDRMHHTTAYHGRPMRRASMRPRRPQAKKPASPALKWAR